MMSIRKKSAYLKDYELVSTASGKKRLVYHGDWYQCAANSDQWRRYKRLSLSLVCTYVLLWCIATLSDPSSLRGAGAVYVVVPYVLLCFPILMALFRVVRLQKLSQPLERMDYDYCISSMSLCTIVAIGLGLAAGVAQVVYILLQHATGLSEWLSALCFLAIGASAGFCYRLQSQHNFVNIGRDPKNPVVP